MKMFLDWITGRDLKQYRERKLKRREEYHPSGNPRDLGEGLKMFGIFQRV